RTPPRRALRSLPTRRSSDLARGESVLVGARDGEVLGHILAGLRHGIDAVLLLHQRIDQTPADGGVVNLGVAREGGLGLGQHEGRDRKSTRLNSSHVKISYAV